MKIFMLFISMMAIGIYGIILTFGEHEWKSRFRLTPVGEKNLTPSSK